MARQHAPHSTIERQTDRWLVPLYAYYDQYVQPDLEPLNFNPQPFSCFTSSTHDTQTFFLPRNSGPKLMGNSSSSVFITIVSPSSLTSLSDSV
jgi:hypothetical protein